MIRIPFNESVSATLIALGFTQTSYPAEWEDVGGPEYGPDVQGHNGYDEWTNGATSLFVEDGHIVAVEKNPPEPEPPF